MRWTFKRGGRSIRRAFGLLILSLCLLPASLAAGAESAGAGGASESGKSEASEGSPRAAVQRFLDLCRAGRYDEAGKLLEAPGEQNKALLARRLKAVLDRHLWLDMEKISDVPSGALNDGLSPAFEQLGTIELAGKTEPVRLRRSPREGWLFSHATVERTNEWYASLGDRWLLEHLPEPLLRPGPRDLLWWQWVGLLVSALLSALLGKLASALVQHLLNRAARKSASTWDDHLVAGISAPLTFGFCLLFARACVPWLMLYEPAEQFIHKSLRGLFLVDLLWLLWRLMDVGAGLLLESEWTRQHAGSHALIPLARRAGKAVVAVAAVLLFLSALGYSVTSLIAGLGIGGLAFALASQKTVENLFGAFSIGIDQPFREGDFVRVDDLVGTVEVLGLRSTRFRTLDRTLVSIPNGKLAEMRLETFAARDRLRLACTVGLVYSTTEAQMREVLAGLEQVLRSHPKIWPDVVVVRFKEFASSSLDIEIMAWFLTTDWGEFQLIRQEVLLGFMGVVEKAGSSFAFPTRTLYLENDAGGAQATR